MEAVLQSARSTAVRRGRRLEYLTITWNGLEGLLAVGLGLLAGSVALVGFGMDSAIEVTSGAALLWRLGQDDTPARERAEHVTLKVVGWCFLLLAVYVAHDSLSSLAGRHAPDRSILGIVLAIASLIVMPVLARAKRKVAREIGSAALHADAKQTEFCMYLSVILVAGLALNGLLAWWWADPAAGLLMAPIIAREGFLTLRGRPCCTC